MDITLRLNIYVLMFAAGWAASIVFSFLWRKFIVPGSTYLANYVRQKHDEKYEEKSFVQEVIVTDEESHLCRKKKIKK